jgi:hypothetical protein
MKKLKKVVKKKQVHQPMTYKPFEILVDPIEYAVARTTMAYFDSHFVDESIDLYLLKEVRGDEFFDLTYFATLEEDIEYKLMDLDLFEFELVPDPEPLPVVRVYDMVYVRVLQLAVGIVLGCVDMFENSMGSLEECISGTSSGCGPPC